MSSGEDLATLLEVRLRQNRCFQVCQVRSTQWICGPAARLLLCFLENYFMMTFICGLKTAVKRQTDFQHCDGVCAAVLLISSANLPGAYCATHTFSSFYQLPAYPTDESRPFSSVYRPLPGYLFEMWAFASRAQSSLQHLPSVHTAHGPPLSPSGRVHWPTQLPLLLLVAVLGGDRRLDCRSGHNSAAVGTGEKDGTG